MPDYRPCSNCLLKVTEEKIKASYTCIANNTHCDHIIILCNPCFIKLPPLSQCPGCNKMKDIASTLTREIPLNIIIIADKVAATQMEEYLLSITTMPSSPVHAGASAAAVPHYISKGKKKYRINFNTQGTAPNTENKIILYFKCQPNLAIQLETAQKELKKYQYLQKKQVVCFVEHPSEPHAGCIENFKAKLGEMQVTSILKESTLQLETVRLILIAIAP